MNPSLSYAIIFSLGTVLCFVLWKKSRDRDYLWFSLLGIASATFNVIRFFVLDALNLQPYLSIASIIFSVAVIGIVLAILLKKH
jgi:uncharacterized membrane protein YjjB (DUF3815 family)